jgi:hypothetical protein
MPLKPEGCTRRGIEAEREEDRFEFGDRRLFAAGCGRALHGRKRAVERHASHVPAGGTAVVSSATSESAAG